MNNVNQQTLKQGVSKLYAIPHGKKRVFESDVDLYRYCQRRLVAKSFCLRGYGSWALQEELGENHSFLPINEEKYEQLIRSIVMEAFKQLQQFLVDDCQVDITTLKNPQEIDQFCGILVNCHSILTQGDQQGFFSLIEICYQLNNVTLQQTAMLKLYASILNAYQESIARKQGFPFGQNGHQYDSVWKQQQQMQFIHFYRECQDFSLIQQYFKETYPIMQQYFTISKLRAKLQLFLYYSLKAFKKFCEGDESGIKLQAFTQERLKILSNSSDAEKIRINVIDAFLDGMTNKAHLRLIILMINDYFTRKRSTQLAKANRYFIPPMTSNMNKISKSLDLLQTEIELQQLYVAMDGLEFVNEIQPIDLDLQ